MPRGGGTLQSPGKPSSYAPPDTYEPAPRRFGEPAVPYILSSETKAALTPNGPSATVVYHVNNLVGSGPEILFDAMQVPGIPAPSDTFPGNDSLYVSRIDARLIEGQPDKAEVVVEYGTPSAGPNPLFGISVGDDVRPQIEISSTVQGRTTNLDVNGEVITVAYVPPWTGEGPPPSDPDQVIQGGEVQYMEPMTTFIYRRREFNSPGDKARAFVGKVNQYGVFGDAPKMWLCTGISGQSEDGGLTYNVTYEFQRNKDGWYAAVAYIDPETGQPPGDIGWVGVSTSGGLQLYELYKTANFELLNLTI